MKDSPFIYGTIVSVNSFTNREKEAEKLYSNLINGINTTIISPRRWGKSSLVEKVILDIRKKEKNTKTVIIDLFSVSNEEEFLELFAREVIKASSGRWQEWVNTGKEFFKKLIPKFSMGFDQADFSLSFDWKELKKYSNEVLDLP
ncbi:MAG: AAA family ATPase, partial [Bacteroidia bacterium]